MADANLDIAAQRCLSGGAGQDSPIEPALRFVSARSPRNGRQVRITQDKLTRPAEFALREKLLARSMHVVAQMQTAGAALILAGTDSRRLMFFRDLPCIRNWVAGSSGLSPMEALQAATKNPAEFLGETKTKGTVGAGKIADLLLLDADPLKDVHNTRKIRAFVCRGQLLDRRSRTACSRRSRNSREATED